MKGEYKLKKKKNYKIDNKNALVVALKWLPSLGRRQLNQLLRQLLSNHHQEHLFKTKQTKQNSNQINEKF